jgi:hypothetical protein
MTDGVSRTGVSIAGTSWLIGATFVRALLVAVTLAAEEAATDGSTSLAIAGAGGVGLNETVTGVDRDAIHPVHKIAADKTIEGVSRARPLRSIQPSPISTDALAAPPRAAISAESAKSYRYGHPLR